MKLLILAAPLVALALCVPAQADDTADLKPQAVEACKKSLGTEMPDSDTLCVCMVDTIVNVFGADAATMLKIVIAGFNPSDTAEIAALLEISEDEAKAFVTAADEKMDKVQDACMPK